MRRLQNLLVAFLLAVLFGSHQDATAQTMDNLKSCQNATGDPDAIIEACSVFINTGHRVGGRGAIPPVAHAAIFGLRAVAYARLKKYDLAVADFDRAVRINTPDSPRAIIYTVRGEVRWTQFHDIDGAASDLDQALRLDPKQWAALHARSALYLLQGDDERAEVFHKGAMQADPQKRQRDETSYGLMRHWMQYLKEIQEDGDYANWSGPPLDNIRASVASLETAKEVTSPTTKKDAATPSKDSAATDSCALAATHWQSTESIATRAAFEDHLTRFPNCTFAGLAKARLAALEKPSEPVSAPSRHSAPPRVARRTAPRSSGAAPTVDDPVANVVRSIPDANVRNMINGVLRQNGLQY